MKMAGTSPGQHAWISSQALLIHFVPRSMDDFLAPITAYVVSCLSTLFDLYTQSKLHVGAICVILILILSKTYLEIKLLSLKRQTSTESSLCFAQFLLQLF